MPIERHCYNCMNLKYKVGHTGYSAGNGQGKVFHSCYCAKGQLKNDTGTEKSMNLYTVKRWGGGYAEGCGRFNSWAKTIDPEEWGWLPMEKYGEW